MTNDEDKQLKTLVSSIAPILLKIEKMIPEDPSVILSIADIHKSICNFFICMENYVSKNPMTKSEINQ